MATGVFFVPDPDLLVMGHPIPYNLYINSSALEGRDHHVKIFRVGDELSKAEFSDLKLKYQQVYISELERGAYLRAICQFFGKTEAEKVNILKSSALHHLDSIFNVKTEEVSVDIINQTLTGCRQTVEGFVELLKNYELNQLHELIGNLSFHDFYTYDHSINVSMYCILIYQLIEPDAAPEKIINAGMGGFLHDIGKIKIPNKILNKVGRLTDEEFLEIQKHPNYGKEFLSQRGVIGPKGANVDLIRDVVYQHHENFDGTGYPNRLKGEEIQLLARVTAISDFFDAITTKRSYAEALSVEEALSLMKRSRGKKIDPTLFDRFLGHMNAKYREKETDFQLSNDFDPCQPHVKLKREVN
ncbi:MAG: HD domain-containing protein [Cryobacterium sp.]|nr:HD domain-containing protein [Oligoflexia bacterium]